MLQFGQGTIPRSQELVLYWTVDTSTRCVLVSDVNRLDLRIVSDNNVIRRIKDVDPRVARDIARQWQVEYELTHGSAAAASAEPPCPACGDTASTPYARHAGMEQRTCRSCGHDWSNPCLA